MSILSSAFIVALCRTAILRAEEFGEELCEAKSTYPLGTHAAKSRNAEALMQTDKVSASKTITSIGSENSVLVQMSVITVAHPERHMFMWNVLTNFLKQDLEQPMELVIVGHSNISHQLQDGHEDISQRVIQEGLNAPQLFEQFATLLQDKQFKPFQDNRVRYIRQISSSGNLGELRDAGVKAAQANMIINMDDDDIYDSSHASQFFNTFTANPEAKLAFVQNGIGQRFLVDGSVKNEKFTAHKYIASTHGFLKEAWAMCPYGHVEATEEHALVDCFEKQWNDSVFQADELKRPSNNIGTIKIWWSGGTSMNIWKDELKKQQDNQASLDGYMSYVRQVVQHVHFMQELNGGSVALRLLRSSLPTLTPAHIPPDEVFSKVSQEVQTSATCNSWSIFVEVDSASKIQVSS